MKLQNTPEQIRVIASALEPLHVRTFDCQSCDPKYNAQRNLGGRTHYVEDDTLRWHKSRVLSSGAFASGLLFQITESVALDMHNTSRGFRCVVFDVFGTTVYHPNLDGTFATSKAAEKACSEATFDVVTHYLEVLTNRLAAAHREAGNLAAALDVITAGGSTLFA